MEAGGNCVWIGWTYPPHPPDHSTFTSNRALDMDSELKDRKIDAGGVTLHIPERKLP